MERVGSLVCLLGLGLILPRESLARPDYVGDIPNGAVFDCGTCHMDGNRGPRNAFGLDVQNDLAINSSSILDWSVLYDVDSDGDGQTNGEELGDPCGSWPLSNTNLRSQNISGPGDAQSTSADPNTPSCAPECGNDVVEGDEECDDGNLSSGDGCSAACENEALSTGSGSGAGTSGDTTGSGSELKDSPSENESYRSLTVSGGCSHQSKGGPKIWAVLVMLTVCCWVRR